MVLLIPLRWLRILRVHATVGPFPIALPRIKTLLWLVKIWSGVGKRGGCQRQKVYRWPSKCHSPHSHKEASVLRWFNADKRTTTSHTRARRRWENGCVGCEMSPWGLTERGWSGSQKTLMGLRSALSPEVEARGVEGSNIAQHSPLSLLLSLLVDLRKTGLRRLDLIWNRALYRRVDGNCQSGVMSSQWWCWLFSRHRPAAISCCRPSSTNGKVARDRMRFSTGNWSLRFSIKSAVHCESFNRNACCQQASPIADICSLQLELKEELSELLEKRS